MLDLLNYAITVILGVKGDEFLIIEQLMPSYLLAVKYFVVFFAVMCVVSANPVHSVLYLIATFVGSAALFISLGAEFLGILLIIVYVGAIAVLFLFVVMMLNINRAEAERRGMFLQLLATMTIVLVFVKSYSAYAYGSLDLFGNAAAGFPIYDFSYWAWPDSLLTLGNVSTLGSLLYTYYAHLVLMAGFVLFLAMVASIALTLMPRQSGRVSKAQDKYRQIRRQVSTAVHLSDWTPR